MKKFLIALLFFCIALPGFALEPEERLSDPTQESRARAISQQLRCVVCQNETIDVSNAPLARDLRNLVRERIRAGDTDQQVIDTIVSRYGTFVLFKPPFLPQTFLLWVGPFLIFLLSVLAIVVYYRRQPEEFPQDDPADESEAQT
jgi:cytochrome c-type biogenesis protein CcmH